MISYLNCIIDNDLHFDRIAKIELYDEKMPTFDISMPKTHSFVMGGIINHNSLIATMALIETQRKGGIAVFFDYEFAFSSDRAVSLGLSKDKDKFIYKQPDTAEKGFEDVENIINIFRKSETKKPITIVFDSIASMITRAELEAKYESNMKVKLSLASFMSSALKRIAGQVSRNNITILFLNQTRVNPTANVFTNPEYTAGGNAMKFYASLRIELSKGKKIKDADDNIVGELITAKTIKNKVAPPFKSITYISNFDIGVDLVSTHIQALKDMGKFGSTVGWLEHDGKKYREKEFVGLCKTDNKLYNNILKLF